MRTHTRSYFFFASVVCLSLLFQPSPSHAIICSLSCTKKKCDADLAVAQKCVAGCSGSTQAYCSDAVTRFQQKSAGKTDTKLIKRFHDLFFEAVKLEIAAGKNKWPQVIDSDNPTGESTRDEIQLIAKFWDGQYVGLLKRTPQHIKNLVDACKKDQQQCRTFAEPGAVREI